MRIYVCVCACVPNFILSQSRVCVCSPSSLFHTHKSPAIMLHERCVGPVFFEDVKSDRYFQAFLKGRWCTVEARPCGSGLASIDTKHQKKCEYEYSLLEDPGSQVFFSSHISSEYFFFVQKDPRTLHSSLADGRRRLQYYFEENKVFLLGPYARSVCSFLNHSSPRLRALQIHDSSSTTNGNLQALFCRAGQIKSLFENGLLELKKQLEEVRLACRRERFLSFHGCRLRGFGALAVAEKISSSFAAVVVRKSDDLEHGLQAEWVEFSRPILSEEIAAALEMLEMDLDVYEEETFGETTRRFAKFGKETSFYVRGVAFNGATPGEHLPACDVALHGPKEMINMLAIACRDEVTAPCVANLYYGSSHDNEHVDARSVVALDPRLSAEAKHFAEAAVDGVEAFPSRALGLPVMLPPSVYQAQLLFERAKAIVEFGDITLKNNLYQRFATPPIKKGPIFPMSKCVIFANLTSGACNIKKQWCTDPHAELTMFLSVDRKRKVAFSRVEVREVVSVEVVSEKGRERGPLDPEICDRIFPSSETPLIGGWDGDFLREGELLGPTCAAALPCFDVPGTSVEKTQAILKDIEDQSKDGRCVDCGSCFKAFDGSFIARRVDTTRAVLTLNSTFKPRGPCSTTRPAFSRRAVDCWHSDHANMALEHVVLELLNVVGVAEETQEKDRQVLFESDCRAPTRPCGVRGVATTTPFTGGFWKVEY